ncbi:pilus assembly protein [Roseateles chitinivorans]|uniref:pilus assembly protein n=1 Tax=Roseateles chitinivorans TaxID=2917965 RepID=UPI003D679F99
MTTDELAAKKVLWEYSGTDMGFQFGEPLIAKVERFGWVVMVPAGYNNASGKNHLFILDPKTGKELARIDTPVVNPPAVNPAADAGTPDSPSGMSTISAFYADISSLVAESVYGGDLSGAVWRFDLRGEKKNPQDPFATPVKIAQAADSANNPEPITTRIAVIAQPNTNRRFIAFGTGKLLAASDLKDSQGQRLYAVWDGNAGRFNSAGNLPKGVTFPITPSNLTRLNDLTQATVVDYSEKVGWYVDAVAGYRVITDPVYYGGTVAYAATLPNSSNPCNPSGSSIVYAIDLGSGRSQLANNAAYLSPGFAVTDLQFVRIPSPHGDGGDGGVALAIGGSGDSNVKAQPSGDKDCPPAPRPSPARSVCSVSNRLRALATDC